MILPAMIFAVLTVADQYDAEADRRIEAGISHLQNAMQAGTEMKIVMDDSARLFDEARNTVDRVDSRAAEIHDSYGWIKTAFGWAVASLGIPLGGTLVGVAGKVLWDKRKNRARGGGADSSFHVEK